MPVAGVYWGQIAVATATALGGIYYLSERGVALVTAALLGICLYCGVRWVIAWAYRIRYWHSRGTPGVYDVECPNCHANRYRKSGDWILRCHSCGWTVGWPIIRWLTRSVPAIQLRRTVVGPQLLIVVIAVALVASGVTAGMGAASITAMVGEIQPDDQPGAFGPETTTDSVTAGPTEREPPRTTAGSQSHTGLNRTQIELQIHRFVNDERQQRGLSPLDFDSRLREIARYHSRDMAENDYFSHTSPGGESMGDRYDMHGYSCRISTGGNQYMTGAENIAYTYAYANLRVDGGVESYDGNETAIARGLVTQWMNSQGHRENILRPYWENEGLGVYIHEVDSQTRVYATQNFC